MYKIKIGILTSSRADYGIYQPLLKKMAANQNIDLHILAFGMHLQSKFGLTIKEIVKDNFGTTHKIEGMPVGDSLLDIATGYGKVVEAFAQFWSAHKFDVILALGDRFEMSAAVQASIPFEVKIAHLHGGETTLGATDNIYRHQITLASDIHFVAADAFKARVAQLKDSEENIYNVGALSLDGLEKLALPTWEDVREKFNIPNKPFVLVTVHPETISSANNKQFAAEMKHAFAQLCKDIHLVITMTNADAMGSFYREEILNVKEENPNQITLVESFGKLNYFAAMVACQYMLGNTSSGIIEAASFKKYVVNIGDRQKGRLQSNNLLNVPFEAKEILEASKLALEKGEYQGNNRYSKQNSANQIIQVLENV